MSELLRETDLSVVASRFKYGTHKLWPTF